MLLTQGVDFVPCIEAPHCQIFITERRIEARLVRLQLHASRGAHS